MPRRIRFVVMSLVACSTVVGTTVAACSSFGGSPLPPQDASPPQDDATSPLDGAGDAAAPGACDLDKPFSVPTYVQGEVNSSAHNDDGFWILEDARTAYFSSDRRDGGSAYDIYSAKREDVAAPWGSVAPEPALADAGPARGPVLSPDGLTLYFFRGVGGPTEIWTATRASTADTFGKPTAAAAPLNGGTSRNVVTWVSADGSVLLASDRVGNNQDVYRVEHRPEGFGTPIAIAGLSSIADDLAILTPDELQAFVTSSRVGGQGGLDIYYSRRRSKSEDFPPPKPLDALNTTTNETASFVSNDGCTLYFRRTTPPFGTYKIFVATRPK